MHKDAPLAHLASMAAHEQGKFWEYHDKIFENFPKMKWEDLQRYAGEIGLDVERFKQTVNSGKHKERINADAGEAKSIGATGTPAFFVNGRYLSGAKPFAAFQEVINAELERLKIPIPEAARTPEG